MIFAAGVVLPLFGTSCSSNDDFAERMERRNDRYMNYNERRKIRLDARQARTDAWFERHMY
jgi:hypothetical protein